MIQRYEPYQWYDAEGFPQIMKDDEGSLVKYDDYEALARELENALTANKGLVNDLTKERQARTAAEMKLKQLKRS